MVADASTRGSDEQTEFKLCETANWAVNGVNGVAFWEVASLRPALGKAVHFADRRGQPELAVLPGQNWKLTNFEFESRMSPLPRVAAFTSEAADGCDGPLPALMQNGTIYREATARNAMSRK
jgi:hypothetical protein